MPLTPTQLLVLHFYMAPQPEDTLQTKQCTRNLAALLSTLSFGFRTRELTASGSIGVYKPMDLKLNKCARLLVMFNFLIFTFPRLVATSRQSIKRPKRR